MTDSNVPPPGSVSVMTSMSDPMLNEGAAIDESASAPGQEADGDGVEVGGAEV